MILPSCVKLGGQGGQPGPVEPITVTEATEIYKKLSVPGLQVI